MLPAAHRMRTAGDFTRTVRGGRRVRRGPLVVHHLAVGGPADVSVDRSAHERAGSSLVGFVVGKSVGNSVVRHRVSRRLRAVMAARLDALPAGSCTVVRALPEAERADSAELADAVDAALRRLVTARPDAERAR